MTKLVRNACGLGQCGVLDVAAGLAATVTTVAVVCRRMAKRSSCVFAAAKAVLCC